MEIGFFTLPEKIWNEKKGKFVDNKLYSWNELEEFREENKNQNPVRYAIYLYLTHLYCIKRILSMCASFTKCRF